MNRLPRDLGRCRCRPGCLAALVAADDLVVTADGAALAEHLPEEQRPARDVALTFDFSEVAR